MHDVIVLGAGPAGASAAMEAAKAGLSVALLDEAATAGGQIYRTTPGVFPTSHEPERDAGNALRSALAAADVEPYFKHRVWHARHEAGIFTVHAAGHAGPLVLEARALIVAGGAQERHVPVPGWERPGVMGLACATVMLKAQRILPGRNVVVAGCGPLLLAVAAGIIKGGGRVAALVDVHPRAAWLRDWRALASRPDLVARGAGWLGTLLMNRTPMLHASSVQRIEGAPTVTHVVVAGRTIKCDAVCIGFGLVPSTDITRLLGATHGFNADCGGWHVVVDGGQHTSVPGLFACGDVTGISGAAAAPWAGRIAALGVSLYLGKLAPPVARDAMRPLARKRDRASRFGAAMTRLANPDSSLCASIAPDTLVCLCERLPRITLDAAIKQGASTPGALKSVTRCGMGPCGGRLCDETASTLLALHTGTTRETVGQTVARPPLRPVGLDDLTGDFKYEDMAAAQPAPQ